MAGGNAVITTTVGSIPEVLGPDNGVLVEPGDVDALTDAIVELVGSPATVEGMGRRNRQLVSESFSWNTVTKRLLELYDEACGRITEGPVAER
jgi:glycosyltransferase involved in cell wall biosynthesis